MTRTIRLGVNIDHVATLRNARGGVHPDPVSAALLAKEAGADGITAHLREDRRHIIDQDIVRLKKECALPLNLEMAATQEMLDIALQVRPNAVCLVPERRQELTTEGGLDVASYQGHLRNFVAKLQKVNIKVSLFIDPDLQQLEAARRVGTNNVEFHTGTYAHACLDSNETERHMALVDLYDGVKLAHEMGFGVHAGHGLTYENVEAIAAIPHIVELNIGHFLVGEAVFYGFKQAIQTMRRRIDAGQKQA